MSGHVFVVRGDMRRLSCDVWCLPCNGTLQVICAWIDTVRGEMGLAESQAELAHVRDAFERVELEHRGVAYPRYVAHRERLTGLEGWGRNAKRVAEIADWQREWGPRPILLNVGSSRDRPVEWYMEGLRQYVELAHERLTGPEAPPPLHGRARPLVAVHAVGTGAGGADWRKAQIIWPQLALLQAFVSRPECGIDVAFVAWEASTFAAAQACRRANLQDPTTLNVEVDAAAPPERFWPDLSPRLREAARKLARRAAAGNLVLFLGAGISAPAGLPDWGGLLREAAESNPDLRGQLDGLSGLELLDQAQLIERRLPELRNWIAARLGRSRCALGHALLASLPVNEAVTQNYDQLFELAAAAAELPTAVIPGTEATDAHRWLLKMHGSVDRPDEIVLTREDYLRYGERRAALAGIVQALLITKHMLFVGFSLSDPNFHRIADDVRKVLRGGGGEHFGTVLLLHEEPLREQLWEDDLRLLPQASADADIAVAARRHDVFLDYLLYEASASAGYLLDPGYAHGLTAAENKLKTALLDLRHVGAELAGTPAWEAVARLLRELGAEE